MKLKGHIQIIDNKTGKVLFEKDNLITDIGLRLLRDSFMRNIELGVNWIYVTDNDTTPAVTDTFDDFFNTEDDQWAQFYVEKEDKSGFKVVWTATAGQGSDQGIFTWKKLGLVAKNTHLIAETAINFSSKTTSNEVSIRYEIGVGR